MIFLFSSSTSSYARFIVRHALGDVRAPGNFKKKDRTCLALKENAMNRRQIIEQKSLSLSRKAPGSEGWILIKKISGREQQLAILLTLSNLHILSLEW